jgi:hypothetical protein
MHTIKTFLILTTLTAWASATLRNHCYILKEVESTPKPADKLRTVERMNCWSDWDLTNYYCKERAHFIGKDASCDTETYCFVRSSYDEIIAKQHHFSAKCEKY